MTRIVGIISFFIIIALLIIFIFTAIKKGASGIKIMLLGLHVSLLGGIIAVDPNSNLGGVEYLIVFAGLLLSISGLTKDN